MLVGRQKVMLGFLTLWHMTSTYLGLSDLTNTRTIVGDWIEIKLKDKVLIERLDNVARSDSVIKSLAVVAAELDSFSIVDLEAAIKNKKLRHVWEAICDNSYLIVN